MTFEVAAVLLILLTVAAAGIHTHLHERDFRTGRPPQPTSGRPGPADSHPSVGSHPGRDTNHHRAPATWCGRGSHTWAGTHERGEVMAGPGDTRDAGCACPPATTARPAGRWL